MIDHIKPRRGRFAAMLLVAVAIGLLLLYGLYQLDNLQERVDESAKELADQEATSQALEDQIRDMGGKPVVDPGDVDEGSTVVPLPGKPGERGLRGLRGLPGKSCIEELGLQRCRGDAGIAVDGEDGERGLRGLPGKSCIEELGLEPCRGDKGDVGATGPAGGEGPKGDKGDTGTARPGTYRCPDGEVMVGFTVAADGSVSLACSPFVGPPTQP